MTFTLPVERSVASENLSDYSILLYGLEKIGKTSLASMFSDAFFFMFEPGSKSLEIYSRPVTKWEDFQEGCRLLAKEKRFKNIVIDTADVAYASCMAYTCNQMGIDHPSDGDHGKGWNRLRVEYAKWMNYIQSIGKGVIFISHAQSREIKNRLGETSDRIVPTMAKQASEILEAMVDIMVYYGYTADGKRTLRVRGNDEIMAGTRTKKNFIGITEIPAGNSCEEAYANFVKAFRNEQLAPAPQKVGLRIKKA